MAHEFSKLDYSSESPEITAADLVSFRKVLGSRRSVRIYDGTPIPPEVVTDCLNMGLLAPNSSNLQPWEFYWVRSAEKKQAIVEACMSQPAAKTAAELIICVSRPKSWPTNIKKMVAYFIEAKKRGAPIPDAVIDYYSNILPGMLDLGPLSLRGCLRRVTNWFKGSQIVSRQPVDRADMRIWATKSTALACENIMLGFRAHGFDSCPMEGLDSKRVKEILELASDAEVVMAISAGKRAANGLYGPRFRIPRENFVKEV